MAETSCAECRAICQEFEKLLEAARRNRPSPGTTIEEMLAWFEQRLESREVRRHPSPDMLLRRIFEHRKQTGHHVPIPRRPLPPGGLMNPN